ncbi:MAG: helix-turn-helix domain-containing protein [Ardenticatenaceae bacterium]
MNSTIGSHNVFLDLGFEPEEAENLLIRSNLMLDVRRYIRQHGWSEEEAAAFFGERPLYIRDLMQGEIDSFSIEKLIAMLVKTGMRIKVEVLPLALAA